MTELSPATIGLIGALVGALIGLSGTWLANRYVALRAERAFRRQVYTDFIATVITTQTYQDRNLQLYEAHEGHVLAVRLADSDQERRAAQKLVKADSRLFDANKHEFHTHRDELTRESHRIKIAGHPLVWETGLELYTALGYYLPDYPSGIIQAAHEQISDALNHFSDVARADVNAPGRKRWRALRRQHRSLLTNGRQLAQEADQFMDIMGGFDVEFGGADEDGGR